MPGPRTRSRANATAKDSAHAATTMGKEPTKAPATTTEKEATEAPTATQKEVKKSFPVKIIKPTCSKLLKQCGNFESGSIAAYMALRERQKQNQEAPLTIEDDGSSLPNADEENEEVQAGNTCAHLINSI